MKKIHWLFPALCLLFCLIPSVGMLFFPTTETTENRAMAQAPSFVTSDGSFNPQVISEFEAYFTEHMAGRNLMVSADARIQKGLFGVSNVDGVICGSDGWLYYSSTLPDYLGTELMTERELKHLAHNFELIQQYLEEKGINFVVTLPPNKNTLYGENMPYYKSAVVNPEHNIHRLSPLLEARNIRYLDLAELFAAQDETLYLLRDSHWNGKGACMAYDALLDELNIPHTDAADFPGKEIHVDGDLNRMLYSFYGPTEKDISYTPDEAYTITEGEDVEDGWLVTRNENGHGTLLMFRDSFANTLIPFLSDDFETACYSKGEPNAMERYLEDRKTDCVIIEKVERNIRDYLVNPPILTAPTVQEPLRFTIVDTMTTIELQDCEYDADYIAVSGTADLKQLTDDTEILISVNGKCRRAYQTGEDGFLLYLKKSDFPSSDPDIRVFAVNGDECVQILRAQP